MTDTGEYENSILCHAHKYTSKFEIKRGANVEVRRKTWTMKYLRVIVDRSHKTYAFLREHLNFIRPITHVEYIRLGFWRRRGWKFDFQNQIIIVVGSHNVKYRVLILHISRTTERARASHL